MDSRKKAVSKLEVCRFCLSQNKNLIPLYDKDKIRTPKNSVPFALKILTCVAIEIFPSDRMPQYICHQCKLLMEISYSFKQLCRQADESILQYIQYETPLNPLAWPSNLNKVCKSMKKSEGTVMKTVVEGGVQVTAQEVSDSEEGEDDNVYNIKIGDGSEDCKSIKIITSVNKETKSSGSKRSQGFAAVSKLTRHLREHAGARSYPCKYCGKSFTKSHHYTRHVRLTHKAVAGNSYRCEECDATFRSQDQLLYHSALHATKNLVCPLCQEKFDDVDAVTAHIKSHVSGAEFMCDFCELIFTCKEKLDAHISNTHDEELLGNAQETENDESSMDMDAEDENEEENSIAVKEENGHMVVEIKNTNEYMLPASQRDEEDKTDQTQSEDSDVTNTDSPNTGAEAMPTPAALGTLADKPADDAATEPASKPNADQPPSILLKVEEMRRKIAAKMQIASMSEKSLAERKDKSNMKVESGGATGATGATGASDKSLRLLEKELQDLKRTNTVKEAAKTPVRSVETARNRRPQIFSSTPKPRPTEKKEAPASKPIPEKVAPVEKKLEKKLTKDTKELKEVKTNNNNLKEDKELKDKGNGKENKDAVREEKKEIKTVVKNGAAENSPVVAEEAVRRSNRPSRVKDYAKMIRDTSLTSDEDSGEEDTEEEDYKEVEKTPEARRSAGRGRVAKPSPAPAATPPAATPAPRKRGRPRKEPQATVPTKIKKDDPPQEHTETESAKVSDPAPPGSRMKEEVADETKALEPNTIPLETNSNLVVSPSGQTLKKIPLKSLPPGVKPLPLSGTPRLAGGREVCEMQIGKKVVKVQKIVMTKAEVEAMAKKGLVEMKDGTMVLKQGIKLPVSDAMSLKSKLVGHTESKPESPSKEDNGPTSAT